MKELIAANNKTSAKLSWKRKEALQIAASMRDYFQEKGFPLPPAYQHLFGRGFKITEAGKKQTHSQLVHQAPELFGNEENISLQAAVYAQEIQDLKKQYNQAREQRAVRFFTDRETGECFYDDYVELAKAYYTLRNNSPAVYALFKHTTNNHYLKQLVATCCSRHRLDPVWNYRKSKLIRGLWYRFLQNSRVHEVHQPMHLMLTVPHKDGQWRGKEFYAREFIDKFNQLRKYRGWKRLMYGGEYGIEVTRSGKDGLHIHLHSLVFQRKEFSRDLANRYIRKIWRHLTGAEVTWYETLYVYRKDAAGKFIMEASDGGIPVLDKSGKYTDDVYNYSLETEGIRGKKKKFYLDDREVWFMDLTDDEKLKYYCDGVMECIKYHFKTDCFKAKDGSWDVELMKDVLKHSRNLRMYSKFGAFYREKSLNYSRLEKPDKPTLPDDETQIAAEGINPDSDGVEGRILNPYTAKPAEAGDYSVVLALPEEQPHSKDKNGNVRAPVSNQVHDIFFKIRHGTSIREVISAIMVSQYERILIQADLERLQKFGWRAPRGEVLC